MAIHVVKEPVPKPGTLGRTELYALAIGQVIGAGAASADSCALNVCHFLSSDPFSRFHPLMPGQSFPVTS